MSDCLSLGGWGEKEGCFLKKDNENALKSVVMMVVQFLYVKNY